MELPISIQEHQQKKLKKQQKQQNEKKVQDDKKKQTKADGKKKKEKEKNTDLSQNVTNRSSNKPVLEAQMKVISETEQLSPGKEKVKKQLVEI